MKKDNDLINNLKLISKEIRKSKKTGKSRVVYVRLECPTCRKIKRIYFK